MWVWCSTVFHWHNEKNSNKWAAICCACNSSHEKMESISSPLETGSVWDLIWPIECGRVMLYWFRVEALRDMASFCYPEAPGKEAQAVHLEKGAMWREEPQPTAPQYRPWRVTEAILDPPTQLPYEWVSPADTTEQRLIIFDGPCLNSWPAES